MEILRCPVATTGCPLLAIHVAHFCHYWVSTHVAHFWHYKGRTIARSPTGHELTSIILSILHVAPSGLLLLTPWPHLCRYSPPGRTYAVTGPPAAPMPLLTPRPCLCHYWPPGCTYAVIGPPAAPMPLLIPRPCLCLIRLTHRGGWYRVNWGRHWLTSVASIATLFLMAFSASNLTEGFVCC